MKKTYTEKQTTKSLAMPASLWKKLERLAKIDHRSTSSYIRLLLQEHVRNKKL